MTQRVVEDLPVLSELDSPEWGMTFDWVACDLFPRQPEDLMRAPWGDVVAFCNRDVNALRADPNISHQTLADMAVTFAEPDDARGTGFMRFMEHNSFGLRPPEHTPLKKWVSRPLIAKSIGRYREDLSASVHAMIEGALTRGELDFVYDFAKPLVATFWSHTLGLTLDEAAEAVHLAEELMLPGFKVAPTPDEVKASNKAAHEYMDVLVPALERGINNGDVPILADFAADSDRAASVRSAEGVAATWAASVIDGFHTFAALITNVVYAAVEAGIDLTPAGEDSAYATNVALEGMRLHPAIIFTLRQAVDDLVYDSTLIPRDANVAMMWMFASRDPQVFPEPNKYILERPNRQRQYTFGGGPYICAGRHLAQFACEVLIAELGRAAVTIERTGCADWVVGSIIHELMHFPVIIRRN